MFLFWAELLMTLVRVPAKQITVCHFRFPVAVQDLLPLSCLDWRPYRYEWTLPATLQSEDVVQYVQYLQSPSLRLSLSLSFQTVASPSTPVVLDSPQVLDSQLMPPLASPTRARSPDVISSASTVMSQDIPEIASQALQLQRRLVSTMESLTLSAFQANSMASAASALHLLTSPRSSNSNR